MRAGGGAGRVKDTKEERNCVCVCVCVCEEKRERERERERKEGSRLGFPREREREMAADMKRRKSVLVPLETYAYDALIVGGAELGMENNLAAKGNGVRRYTMRTRSGNRGDKQEEEEEEVQEEEEDEDNSSRRRRRRNNESAPAVAAATEESFSGQSESEHERNLNELRNFNMKAFEKTDGELISLAMSMYRAMGLVEEYEMRLTDAVASGGRGGDYGDGKSNARVNAATLHRFLRRVVSTSVKDVPYHNTVHFFSVLHTTWHILYYAKVVVDDDDDAGDDDDTHNSQKIARLWTCFDGVALLAVLTAAFAHDAGHIGVTNSLLVNLRHDLALRYNDDSVLENYHCSTAFAILLGRSHARPSSPPSSASASASTTTSSSSDAHGTANVFANLNTDEYKRARKLVISAILNTDMARHFVLLDTFKSKVTALKAEAKERAMARGIDCESRRDILCNVTLPAEVPGGSGRDRPEVSAPCGKCATIPTSSLFAKSETRDLFLTLLVHVADIANAFKTFDVYSHFADALCREFQHQVYLERKFNLPVSTHLLGIELTNDDDDETATTDMKVDNESDERSMRDLSILIGQCELEIGFTSVFASPSLSELASLLGDNLNESFKSMTENERIWRERKVELEAERDARLARV